MNEVDRLAALLPEELRTLCGELPDDLEELRVRSGRPVQLVCRTADRLLGVPVGPEVVGKTAQALAGHSLYAREEELREGFFTIAGGCRVGVCGRMTVREGSNGALTHIGSVCVRIARAVEGAADGVMDALFEGGRPVSALVISPPGLGKTTLLRDIARQLSDGAGGRPGMRVAIADERGELAGCVLGVPALNVGRRTDVMDGCPKRESMRILVRAMSPEVIVTDELGHPGDAAAVRDVMRSGVSVIASVHARDEQEAAARVGGGGLFRRMIVLGGRVGQVSKIISSDWAGGA